MKRIENALKLFFLALKMPEKYNHDIFNLLNSVSQNKPPAIWIKYDRLNMQNRPPHSGKYFVHRKDGKIHWETWNNCGFAYNDNVITHFLKIYKPNGNESTND